MFELSKILVWLGSAPRVLVILILSALLLLSAHRSPSVEPLLKDSLFKWIVLVLTVAVSGLVTYLVEHGWKFFNIKRKENASSKKCIARLGDLTPQEKVVLQQYLKNQTTTQKWHRGSGAVCTLAEDGVLKKIWTDPDPHSMLADTFAITDTAWKHLKHHPELVDPVD